MSPYLDYILDKERVIQESKKIVEVVKEKLNKEPIDYAKSDIEFLNGITEEDMRKDGIRDKNFVITWARKVVNQYHNLETVEAKIDIMAHAIKVFVKMFEPLVKMGFPFFWKEKGGMWSQKEYYDLLIQCELDQSKFTNMQKSLSGKEIVDKLADDFKIVFNFRATCAWIPNFSYRDHMEMQVLLKETSTLELPTTY